MYNAIELSSRPITLAKEGTFGIFSAQQATPLALVITELIHNSLEHGLAETGDTLRAEISRTADSCTISIIDNGGGLPEDFEWEQSSNLGLQIVLTLTENELKGTISLTRVGDQTWATLNFPIR